MSGLSGSTRDDGAAEPLPFSAPVAVAKLGRSDPFAVSLHPEARECEALARTLGVIAVRNLAMEGEIVAWQAAGWQLAARLRADVEQRCVVTLEPVLTALDLEVERRYLPVGDPALAVDADPDEPIENADETAPEPVGATIELAAVVVEAIALELDPWPRAEGASFGSRVHGPPGSDPMTDEAMRPFARLAGLRDQLKARTDTADD